MTFENESKTIPVAELEPLIEKIETIAATLSLFLQECGENGFPSQDFCLDIDIKLRKMPDLHKWLDELRRNESR